MHLISDIAAWDREKEITKNWSGIVFYPGKNASWQNEENDKATKLTLQKNNFAAIGIFLGLTLFLWAAVHTATIAQMFFGLLSLTGLVIAFFILAAELGYQNTIVKQVCGAVSAGGCEKVLQSKQAKSIFGFTPADAGLIYFLTQFIAFISSVAYPALLPVAYLVALSGIAVAGWSIYTQAIVLKKYCALCLGLVVVLLLQFILVAFAYPSFAHPATSYLSYAGIFTFLAIALFPIKHLLKTTTAQAQKVAELRKWKTDVAIFNALSANERTVDTTIWENDLLLGNPDAPVLITVACNPYCGPCAKAHVELDEILEMYPGEVAVQVRLMCNPASETDARTIATKAILQQAAFIKNHRKLQQMLSDWFANMNLEMWLNEWKAVQENTVDDIVQKHQLWTKAAEIVYTPTFFVNGRHLSGKYNLENIKQLIPELATSSEEIIFD